MSAPRIRSGWILGPRADLWLFSAPLVAAFALIALAARLELLHAELPPWAFAALIVGCDVAHVWATAFRVYLDPRELTRRLPLYLGVPLLCLAGGIALHAESRMLFWRALAYLAAFHFVRQQWGWVAYSRARAGERGRLDRVLDELAIYAVTLGPLLWWHARLPREFAWFLEGDFIALPGWVGSAALGTSASVVAAYLLRQLWRLARGQGVNWAKLHVFATTAIAWYGGIVWLDSDLAFTALNVLAHGVPYLAVVWRVERARWAGESGALARLFAPGRAWLFLALLVAAGYAEEWLWDRSVWHEHPGLFAGPALELGRDALSLLVPLLALPQATHYVLDAWIWRRARHAELREVFAGAPQGAHPTDDSAATRADRGGERG